MTDIINLNKARKAKLKQSRDAQAAENRIRYGLSTRTRKLHAELQEKAKAQLEQHRLNSEEKH